MDRTNSRERKTDIGCQPETNRSHVVRAVCFVFGALSFAAPIVVMWPIYKWNLDNGFRFDSGKSSINTIQSIVSVALLVLVALWWAWRGRTDPCRRIGWLIGMLLGVVVILLPVSFLLSVFMRILTR